MESRYALDKQDAKFLGVCSGLARSTGWDPLLIRLGVVGLTLFALGPVMVLIYFIIAWVADAR